MCNISTILLAAFTTESLVGWASFQDSLQYISCNRSGTFHCVYDSHRDLSIPTYNSRVSDIISWRHFSWILRPFHEKEEGTPVSPEALLMQTYKSMCFSYLAKNKVSVASFRSISIRQEKWKRFLCPCCVWNVNIDFLLLYRLLPVAAPKTPNHTCKK